MREGDVFTVLLSGALVIDDRVRRLVAGSRVIAADGGMAHADGLGVKPELWVGDFDSTDAALSERFPDVERQGFPPAKNETDGALAVAVALERGARRIVMAGALQGERTDHGMMNMLHAVSLAEGGIDIVLTSGTEEAWPLLPGTTTIDMPKGALFSILGFADLSGLSIENAGYELDGFEAPFGLPRTVSNIAGKSPVAITLKTGRGIVLVRPHDFSGV
ncbi:thiamine diphosphokinase [Martelella endophytica]|uniref:Thiamine diphosphokinase n=1 Tax=Martelella endophytica TaxID=1486262 RepID=A0A0D5LKM9_MAREN|nr:thiamine diphosphokinase [Martelella endophytica]AJY44716.1 thiamine pyrophosphokinase [Martelella endophytica]